jgi:hypothetical protein
MAQRADQAGAALLMIGIILAVQVPLVKEITVEVAHSFGLITKRITSNAVMHIGKLVVAVVRVDHLQQLLPQHTLVKVAITIHGVNQL